jgi:ribosome-associated protein
MGVVRVTAARKSGVYVRAGLVIPDSEIEVRATRAAGPGGQNVNKVSTRIELRFDVGGSTVLKDEEKQRLRTRLHTRTSRAGVLRVVCQKHRTRAANERAARERLAELLRAALHVRRARRPTRPTAASRARRRADKRRRADAKRSRRRPAPDD